MSAARTLSALNRHAPKSHLVRFVDECPFSEDLWVRQWRLANGLSVTTLQDRSAPVISYQSWMSVGSRDEESGRTGLAHFFEHLMFVGTERFPAGAFDRVLEGVGADFNAATWTDWTQYYATIPSKELKTVVELEADRLRNLSLGVQQIASEKEVVISERRDRVDDDVSGKASELLFQLAYRKHGYGHPTIGWMRDIRRYDAQACRAFARAHYHPRRANVVLAGHFDERRALGMVQEAYGDLKKRPNRQRTHIVEPRQRKERRLEVSLPTGAEKLLLAYKAPAIGDPDWRVLAVVGDVLFGGRSSRLYRELVLESELASSCYGSLTPFEEPGLYEVGVSLREGVRAEEALERIEGAMARLIEEGVDAAELERSKARSELSLLSSLESIAGKGEQLGFDLAVLGRPLAVQERIDAYARIDAADVLRVARERLRPAQRSAVFVRPKERR